jgi:hypothetical protein
MSSFRINFQVALIPEGVRYFDIEECELIGETYKKYLCRTQEEADAVIEHLHWVYTDMESIKMTDLRFAKAYNECFTAVVHFAQEGLKEDDITEYMILSEDMGDVTYMFFDGKCRNVIMDLTWVEEYLPETAIESDSDSEAESVDADDDDVNIFVNGKSCNVKDFEIFGRIGVPPLNM